MSDHRADLVFEGGGVKGIGLAGAFCELSERGYVSQCVAGTSTGAIAAALVAVGYSGAEIEEIALRQVDFSEFADPDFIGDLGKAGAAFAFLLRRGIHSGKHFLDWMHAQLAAKGKTKFGDLRDESATLESRRYRLQVIASDLTTRSMLVLPRDAALIGIADPDELEIALAVRMSMSIPIYFEPVVYRNARTGEDHVIVDGALLSNFPIWLFDAADGVKPAFPTLGLRLATPGQREPVLPHAPASWLDVQSDIRYLKTIVETMIEARDRQSIDEATLARTISIPTLGTGALDFAVARERREELFAAGRDAAATFLDAFDFDAYVERFTGVGPAS